MAKGYTPDEERSLARALIEGEPRCPRCSVPMSGRHVPPRSDVAYVRDRVWLSCDSCGRKALLDRRPPPPENSAP